MQGKIVKGIAGFYYVHVEGHDIYECKAKGIFRKNHEKPLVGDNCEMDVIDEDNKKGNITEILERKNSLIRPNVANVDQALVIFASIKPEPNFNLLDRFLILMEQNDIPSIICFNKKDLIDEESMKKIYEVYANTGNEILFVSAKTGEGIEEIRKRLDGKTSTVAGPSGVGKSSIINLLQNNIVMETGNISEKIARGKHTTRHSELIALGRDSYILDTPGFSSLGLFNVGKNSLKEFYPEMVKYGLKCRFDDCVHNNEPDCGVKQAVENGLISPQRYENYLLLLEECQKSKQW